MFTFRVVFRHITQYWIILYALIIMYRMLKVKNYVPKVAVLKYFRLNFNLNKINPSYIKIGFIRKKELKLSNILD